LAEASGGYGTISYKWQYSTDNSSWSEIASSNNAAYTTPALQINTYYRRIATGATCGAHTSTSALVTVHPEFTQTNPAGTTICYNTTATFDLAAASGGYGAISYQWQKSTDGISNWATADGTSTNAAYTTTALKSHTYYRRIATGATCGAATSTSALVTVQAAMTINRSGGNASQTVTQNSAITAISYTADNASSMTLGGSLPAGLTHGWSPNKYAISGSPTAPGTFAYSVTTANSLNCANATAYGTITVNYPAIPNTGCQTANLNLDTVGFTSPTTYSRNGLTISSPVTATYCTGRCSSFDGGSSGAYKADCATSSQITGHLFSWCMVA
jgi:hypothetical protein